MFLYSKQFKEFINKLSYLFFAIFIIFLPSITFANQGISDPNIEIKNIYASVNNTSGVIDGFYNIIDNDNISLSKIYATATVLKHQNETASFERIVSSNSGYLDFTPKENKKISFKITLPKNSVTGSYVIMVEVFTQLDFVIKSQIGNELNYTSANNNFLITDFNRNFTLADKNISPEIPLELYPNSDFNLTFFLKNNTKDPIGFFPRIKTFPIAMTPGATSLTQIDSGYQFLNSGEETNVKINIKTQSKPGDYSVVVQAMDKNGDVISPSQEYRYVITGVTGRIVNVMGESLKSQKFSTNLNLNLDLIGPASQLSELKNAKLKVQLFSGTDQKKQIAETTQSLPEVPRLGIRVPVTFSFPALGKINDTYNVKVQLLDSKDKVLDTTTNTLHFPPITNYNILYILLNILIIFLVIILIRRKIRQKDAKIVVANY